MINSGKKYSVGFLFDENNNWIEEYFLEKHLPFQDKYKYTLSKDPSLINSMDIAFILGYTRLLDKKFLRLNDLNLVVHESELPKGRGFAPVQWQILEGNNNIPICLFEAEEEADSGDVILKDSFQLEGHELYDDIRKIQGEATRKIIFEFLKIFPNYNRTKQIGKGTFFRKRIPDHSELDLDKTIRDQINLLRIANNEEWPTFFYFKDKKYILKIGKEED